MHVADLCNDPEALPDPREEADFALQRVPWLYPSDREAIFTAIEDAGLMFCWKVNP
jgi:hypothetical protein